MRCDLEMSVSFSLDSLKMCVHFQNVRSFSIWHICNCTTHLTLNSNKPILESLPKKHFDSQIWDWDQILVLTTLSEILNLHPKIGRETYQTKKHYAENVLIPEGTVSGFQMNIVSRSK